MIDAGFLPGPRLRASSLEKGAEGVMGVPEGHDPTHDRDIPGLRAYVKSMAELGVDSIKFLMSSDEGFAPGGAQTLMYSEDEAQAIGEAAREAGHLARLPRPGGGGGEARGARRLPRIYHCTYADEEALDMLEAKKDEIFCAPAPGLLYARMHEAQSFGIGRPEAERMGAVSGLELMARNLSRHEAPRHPRSARAATMASPTIPSAATRATSTCSCGCSASRPPKRWSPRPAMAAN